MERAEKLCLVLACPIEDLKLNSEADQLARPEDQKQAAQLLLKSSLIEKLGPLGEWNVIEGLLKATIVPQLPLNILGELYNQLTVASWRQSKMDASGLYNEKAFEIADRTGDLSIRAAALLSRANLLFWKGQILDAIKTYEETIQLGKFIPEKTLAAAYSNLGATMIECGALTQGAELQMRSIRLFEEFGKPMNLAISYGHLSVGALKKADLCEGHEAVKSALAEAEDFNKTALLYAEKDQDRRSIHFSSLVKSEILARRNEKEKSLLSLDKAFHGYTEMGIEEGLNFEFAGRITRILGDLDRSIAHLLHGISISKSYPLYLASLYFELAKTQKARREDCNESLRQALDIFAKCGANAMVVQVQKMGLVT